MKAHKVYNIVNEVKLITATVFFLTKVSHFLIFAPFKIRKMLKIIMSTIFQRIYVKQVFAFRVVRVFVCVCVYVFIWILHILHLKNKRKQLGNERMAFFFDHSVMNFIGNILFYYIFISHFFLFRTSNFFHFRHFFHSPSMSHLYFSFSTYFHNHQVKQWNFF